MIDPKFNTRWLSDDDEEEGRSVGHQRIPLATSRRDLSIDTKFNTG